jgi:hypothetical protein
MLPASMPSQLESPALPSSWSTESELENVSPELTVALMRLFESFGFCVTAPE